MKKWMNILPVFLVQYILKKDGFKLTLTKIEK